MPSNKCSNPQQCWYFNEKSIQNHMSEDGKKPKLIFNPKKAEYFGSDVDAMLIGCRSCPDCLYAYSTEWAIRASCEMQMHKENTFITLTYAERPKYGNLIPADFLNFIRRLKEHYPEKTVRYLYSGERGGKYGRPHFHAIIFGLDFPDKIEAGLSQSGAPMLSSRQLTQIWGHGLALCGEANAHTAAYVCQYVVKKISAHNDGMTNKTREASSINKETGEIEEYLYRGDYIGMSRMPGIGSTFFNKYKSDMFPSCTFHLFIGDKVKPVTIPKYFYRLLEKEDPIMYKAVKLERMKKGKQYEIDHPDENTAARLLAKATCAAAKREAFKRPMSNDGETINPEQTYLKALKIKQEIHARQELIRECDFPIPRMLQSIHSLAAMPNPDLAKIKNINDFLTLEQPDFHQLRRFKQIHYKNEAVKRLKIQIEVKLKQHYEKIYREFKLTNELFEPVP